MLKSKQLCLVFLVSILLSLLNISDVLVGALKTPPGHIYLWTGHYYTDYFVYIQAMVQGSKGKWLVENPFATDDFTKTFLAWGPSLLLGKVAGLFRASPFLVYWLTVAIFSFLLALVIFLTIRYLLSDSPFYLQFSAFLLSCFAAPFFQIKADEVGIRIVPYEFWSAPTGLFKRFGGVPHHLLAQITVLLAILALANTLQKISQLSFPKILVTSLGLSLLMIFLLTFSPNIVFSLLGAIFLTGLFLVTKTYRSQKQNLLFYLILLGTILVFVLPAGLATKYLSGQSGPITRSINWWLSHQDHPPLSLVFLATGPILLFCLFGMAEFFRSISPIKMLVFFLFVVSYGFYFSSIAPLFGTSNVRFLTPLVFILFGVLAALGIERLASFKPAFKKKFAISGVIFLLLLFLPSNKFFFQSRLFFDPNLTYLPYLVYEGFLFLNDQPDDQAVLTAPAGDLGSFLPIFVKRKVYLGRDIFTPQYEAKKKLVFRFYEGKIEESEAERFLLRNGIGYVFWRDMEGFPLENLSAYRFLKPVFENKKAVIFGVLRPQ